MFSSLKTLFNLLTLAQKRKLILFQGLVVFMATLEVISLTVIFPFMSILTDIDLLYGSGWEAELFRFSGINEPKYFIVFLGLGILSLIIISTITLVYTNKKLAKFGAKLGVDLSLRLYEYYLRQSWLFHASGNSSQLIKQLSTEAVRVADGVIQPILQLNSRLIIILFISISIFIFDPVVAISMLAVLGTAYLVIFKVVKSQLKRNGEVTSRVTAERFKLMNESFGGIRDLILLGRAENYIKGFKRSGDELANAKSSNVILAVIPRYILELVAFGALISLIVIMVLLNGIDASSVLATITFFAFAAMKLLPSMQQAYQYASNVKSHLPAFNEMQGDLEASMNIAQDYDESNNNTKNWSSSIQLRDVSFKYPCNSKYALENINITIKKYQTIGIVGSSGSGKSTVLDLILGLLKPLKGTLQVDSIDINKTNLRSWQNNIGYVPQSIFLSDGSVAENIAFGIKKENIEMNRVKQAIKMAHLEELVKNLEHGVDTTVGERGVQLSGGQRQRIGIARALYHDTSLLVFDEATSALDGISENNIMQTIRKLQGSNTIIMIAHRLKTVQDCDVVYFMDNGQIIDKGSYQDLINKNKKFREMAQHA